jgi:hypothetical protein
MENLNSNDEYEILRLGQSFFDDLSNTAGGSNPWQPELSNSSYRNFIQTVDNNQRVILQFLTTSGLRVNWGDGTETIIPPTNHINRNSNYERALAVHKYDENDPSYPNFTVSIYGRDSFIDWDGASAGSLRSGISWNNFSRYYFSGGGAYANDSNESIFPELYKWHTKDLVNTAYYVSNANITSIPRFSYDGEDITSLGYYFKDMHNLTSAPAKVTGSIRFFQYPFFGCTNFNSSLAQWNMSNLNNNGVTSPFRRTAKFNSALPDFSSLFEKSSQRTDGGNGYLANDNFDTMFYEAWAFNQPLDWGDKFNNEQSYNFKNMFNGAFSFNQPINWSVKVCDLGYCFLHAKDFNQPINNWQLSNLDTNSGLYATFNGAYSFDQNLNSWDVSTLREFSNSANTNYRTISFGDTFKETRNFTNGGAPLNWGENLSQFIDSADGIMRGYYNYMFYRSNYNHDLKPWHDAGFFNTSTSAAHLNVLPSAYNHSFRGWDNYPFGTHVWNILQPDPGCSFSAANWDDTLIWLNELLTGGAEFRNTSGSYAPISLQLSSSKRTSASLSARNNLTTQTYPDGTKWIQSISDGGQRS